MPEPVERKCDRHSATRVTAEVYKAGVARMVGDGHSPRTGALVAMSTGWQVTSVDPVLGHHGAHPVIERLHCLRGNIEAFPDLQADIVLAPHSHAPADATRHVARGGGHVITMPCCVVWPVMPWTLKQISMVCMAPDRTIYIERIIDNDVA